MPVSRLGLPWKRWKPKGIFITSLWKLFEPQGRKLTERGSDLDESPYSELKTRNFIMKNTELKKAPAILTMQLENMRKNVITALKQSQDRGIVFEFPNSIQIKIPLDINGLPCESCERAGILEMELKL